MSHGPFSYAEFPDEPPEPPGPEARDRVQLPATFLIVVGAINLLLALGALLFGQAVKNLSPAEVEEIERRMQTEKPREYQQLKDMGLSVPDFLEQMSHTCVGVGGVGVAASLLAIAGGVCMLRLRLYGLAVIAAIVTMIPCISGLSCCGIGEGIGIWALVVLMSDEVRQVFQ